tara:strand:+ start:626 stop:1771 length:1146 start_codon:yes stop_codon:yes gene_type:complete
MAFFKTLIESSTPIRFVSKEKYNNTNKNHILVHDSKMFDQFALKGEVGLCEAYMNGDWDAIDIEYVVSIFLKHDDDILKNLKQNSLRFVWSEIKAYWNNWRVNTIESSQANIAHHYDVGNDLYSKMLGKHMQYTCAYFHKTDMSLDDAQFAKMELIAKKLNLQPGMKVLDLGCGFGSMAYHLALNYDVKVVGVTLSVEQQKYAAANYSHENLQVMVKDYRHVSGTFDRVYSVGLLEHVGRQNYKEYYDKCYDLLSENGIMLIHTISTTQRQWTHNTFVGTYIFPEFELPHMNSLGKPYTDNWHLEDLQAFGLSYAKTLRKWKENIGDWKGLDQYDTKFRRMWTLYLLGCAALFENRDTSLWQIVYTKKNSTRKTDCYHIRN